MATQMDIVNEALTELGQPPSVSINDKNRRTIAIKQVYDSVLENLLSQHNWGFATKTLTLALIESEFETEFDYAYSLPVDFFRLIEGVPTGYPFRILGGELHVNYNGFKLVYVAKTTNVNEMTPEFRSLFSVALQAKAAYAITGSQATQAKRQEDYREKLRIAIANDSRNSTFPKCAFENTWINARYARTASTPWVKLDPSVDYGDIL
jgi:hypothetical protein